MPDATAECPYCDRLCRRCRYEIPGGWDHAEQPQAAESNVVVCSLVQHTGPLVEVLDDYLTHRRDHRSPLEVENDRLRDLLRRTRTTMAAARDELAARP